MNYLHAHRIATYFGDVLKLNKPKASAVFHLEQLSQHFDFTKAGLPAFRIRPSVVIELDEALKIKAKIICTTFRDGEILGDIFLRKTSDDFVYLADKQPIQLTSIKCFKKTLNKLLRNSDSGYLYESEIEKASEVDLESTDMARLVSMVQQSTLLLRSFSDIDYHSPETFIMSLSLAINCAVGVFEPTIALVCDDESSVFKLPLNNEGDFMQFGLIPVYKDGGWLCYAPHSLVGFHSILIYEPEIDLTPYDKVHPEQVIAYTFQNSHGIFQFLDSLYLNKSSNAVYDHNFTETLRIFTFNRSVDVFKNEITEPQDYPFEV